MDAERLATWLRQEHDTVEELAAALRQAVATEPRGDATAWLKDMRHQFASFHAHLSRHFALEEDEGYLLPVLERRPTLAAQVAQLRDEHHQIDTLLSDLLRAVESLRTTQPLIIGDWCVRVRNLLGYLERHEERENLLVTHVFTEDIGSKD